MKLKQLLLGMVYFFTAACVMAADDSIAIKGVDKAGDWTVAKIKSDLAADVMTINYTGHDGKHAASAVPLLAVLKAAGAATEMKQPAKGTDPKAKHAELHQAVMIVGRDGYEAVFSMAELMTDLGNKHVWLALDVDGKPWPAAEAPMKLVVSDDDKPARWVHSVQSITVVKVEPATTQPAR